MTGDEWTNPMRRSSPNLMNRHVTEKILRIYVILNEYEGLDCCSYSNR